MLLMVKKINSNFKFYYTQCEGWEAVVPATTPKGACSISICQAVEEYGKEILDSVKVMLAMDVRRESNEQNGDSISVFQVQELTREIDEH